MTGQGGWPMTVLPRPRTASRSSAAPTSRRADRHGMPSFRQVLRGVAEPGRPARRGRATARRGRRHAQLGRARGASPARRHRLDADAARRRGRRRCARELRRATRGGFGGAPKFPPSMVLEFLLRHHGAHRRRAALEMVGRHLRARWRAAACTTSSPAASRATASTRDWVVPHFEKMLYDNALLLRVYAALVAGDRLAARPADRASRRPTSCSRDLRTPEGGFASALDADSRRATEGADLRLDAGELARCSGRRRRLGGELLRCHRARARSSTARRRCSCCGDPDDDAALGRRSAPRCSSARGRARAAGPRRQGGRRLERPGDRGARRGRRAARRPDLVDAAARGAPSCCSTCTSSTAGCAASRATASSARRPACSRTTATSPRACSRCTRPPASGAGSTVAGRCSTSRSTHFADGDGGFFDTADDARAAASGGPQDPTDNATPSGPSARRRVRCSPTPRSPGRTDHRDAAERRSRGDAAIAGRSRGSPGGRPRSAEALARGPAGGRGRRRPGAGSASPGWRRRRAPSSSAVGDLSRLARRPAEPGRRYVCRGVRLRRPAERGRCGCSSRRRLPAAVSL